MTEVSAAAVYSTERLYTPGSVGAPFVTNILATFDPETHEELGINQEGEIRISTPTMMYGYNKNQAATDDIIKVDPDGKRWISTGDLGRIDSNGNVFLIGRIKRMIVRSGNKIFPSNIENIISKIDGVEQCCIVGAPSKKEKTVPVAYMVIDEDHYDCENELIEEAKKKISIDFPEFNIPTKFIFRSEFLHFITTIISNTFKSIIIISQYINLIFFCIY
jgi:long-chain acyl-CoA synthetase